MSRLPVMVAVLALLVVGCGSSTADEDLAPLAEQADRVATLLDDGRPCEAATAAQELGTMARADVSVEVRDAVTAFAEDAASSITCPPPATEPPATEPPPPAPPSPAADPGPPQDHGGDEGEDDEDDDSDDEDRGNGRGNGRGRGGDD